jgi:hypothetical protein
LPPVLCFVYFSIEENEWNKSNDEIGAPGLTDGVKHEDFVGAEKETSKLCNSINNHSFRSRPNCACFCPTMLLWHCDDPVYYVLSTYDYNALKFTVIFF